jgi:hypothetical protein
MPHVLGLLLNPTFLPGCPLCQAIKPVKHVADAWADNWIQAKPYQARYGYHGLVRPLSRLLQRAFRRTSNRRTNTLWSTHYYSIFPVCGKGTIKRPTVNESDVPRGLVSGMEASDNNESETAFCHRRLRCSSRQSSVVCIKEGRTPVLTPFPLPKSADG